MRVTITSALLLSAAILFVGTASAKPSVNKAQALQAHNQARAQDRQRPLQWSADLESISQKWANQLARSCKMYHHKGNIPFGENIVGARPF